MLLRALFRLTTNVCTTCLDNLLHFLPAVNLKKVFFSSSLNPLFQFLLDVHPPSIALCSALMWRPWLCPFNSLLVYSYLKLSLLQAQQAPVPQYLLTCLKIGHLHRNEQDLPPWNTLRSPNKACALGTSLSAEYAGCMFHVLDLTFLIQKFPCMKLNQPFFLHWSFGVKTIQKHSELL